MSPHRQISPGLILLLLLLVASGPLGLLLLQMEPPRPVELQVMSFNIRNGHGKDGDNRWEFRKEFVCDLIRERAPDVISLQEVHHFQLEHLLAHLPKYASVGVGRDGGSRGEHSPILYRRDRFDLLEGDTFWLSETPKKPSTSWRHHYRRICTWVSLRDRRSSRTFHVYNTHLDHQSALARYNSVRLIMATIAARPTADPFILCGDLNAGEDSKPIAFLKGTDPEGAANPLPLADTWRVIHPGSEDNGTISHFSGSREPKKIDYIMTTPEAEVLSAAILRIHRNGRYPSDHYPVTARVKLR